MPTIRLNKGLPASGKTTDALAWLKDHDNWVRICKDDLRAMVDGGRKFTGKREERILETRDALIWHFLVMDLNIIIDDTNLHPKHLQRMNEIAEAFRDDGIQVGVEVKFFDTPLLECIYRDAARPNPVGRKVITNMYEQFLKPKPVPYNPELPDGAIVDMDGTLAQKTNRDWHDYSRVLSDDCNFAIAHLVTELSRNNRIFVVSGRPESARTDTRQWLMDHFIPFHHLFMRPDGDNRPDQIVKREIYDREIRDKFNITAVIDDRTKVVEMWRSLGLPTLQCNYGDF